MNYNVFHSFLDNVLNSDKFSNRFYLNSANLKDLPASIWGKMWGNDDFLKIKQEKIKTERHEWMAFGFA